MEARGSMRLDGPACPSGPMEAREFMRALRPDGSLPGSIKPDVYAPLDQAQWTCMGPLCLMDHTTQVAPHRAAKPPALGSGSIQRACGTWVQHGLLTGPSSFCLQSFEDARHILEYAGVELARMKAETRRMARWLRAKKLALKSKKKETRSIKRENQVIIASTKRMQKLVEDFLVTVEAENNNDHIETAARIWSEEALKEAIEGMNDLNLDGNNNTSTVNTVQSCCSSCSAAEGDNDSYKEGGGGRKGGGHGGGNVGGCHQQG